MRKERGLQWPCPTETHPGTVRRYVGGEDPFVSPGKKIEFYGQPDKRAVVFLRAYEPSPEQPNDEYPFTLTTGRVLEQWHTGTITYRIPELRQASGRARFELNDQDALRLGIQSGASVEVRSRYGRLTGSAFVTDRPRQGMLFASFYDAKFLLNALVSDQLDPVSKQPEYKITAVSVRKATG